MREVACTLSRCFSVLKTKWAFNLGERKCQQSIRTEEIECAKALKRENEICGN